MKIITEKLQNLWNSDEVRVLVLVSLGIQIALIFLAPLRKRITNIMLALALWLLYLTADNVATLGLGNISHQTPGGIDVSSELTVLWAPFLLVHLGGPDTITSYSIEDNELWWRHLLGLVFQVIITVYIFIQSPPTGWLWIPTIFVFIPGLIKFAERTHALRIASKDNIKDQIISELRPGNRTTEGNTDNTTPNPVPANRTTEDSEVNTLSNDGQANETTKGFWGNLMVYMGKLKGNMGKLMGNMGKLMGSIQSVLFPPEDTIGTYIPTFLQLLVNCVNSSGILSIVKTTLRFNFNIIYFDILVSSLKDSSKDIHESELILEGFRWFNIFKRLLVDVTFSADLLMKSQDRFSDLSTTVALDLVAIELSFLYDYLHTKAVHMHCFSGRALRFFSLLSIIFAFVVFHNLDMQKYVSGDIIITNILFGVGLSLEVIATILLVFSDWTVVALKRTQKSDCVASCITALVKVISKKGKRRWAHTIGHFNLVHFSRRDRDTNSAKIMRFLNLKNKWDNMCESKLIPFPDKLVEIMVTEAKRRAQNVHIYKVLVEARAYRGNKTLERHNQLEKLEWSMKMDFDESIILWHLATDICYYQDETPNKPNPQKPCCLKSCFSSKQSNENQEPSHQSNGENQEPSHKPCCLKSCLSSKQSNENQEPSHQSNGENQEPSHKPCCLKSCFSSKQSNENQEPSHQSDGENQEPSHKPCCLKSCLSSKQSKENQEPSHKSCCLKSCFSSKQSNENQEPSHQPDGENQQPSNQPNGENQKPSSQPNRENQEHSDQPDRENQQPSNQPNGVNQEHSNQPNKENQQPSNQPNGVNQEHSDQPDGDNQQPSNQSNGENQKPSSQPNRENQEHSDQPDGENQEPSNQPDGVNQEHSNQPDGENQEHSNQPDGENQEHSNQPDGENQEHSNQPDGENQQPSNQPNGENQQPSNQPNGENQEHSNQPNERKKIPINCLKSCCSSKPNGENQQSSNKSCLSCLCCKQPNGKEDTEREVSWMTSNYMIYLLTQQQSMMQLGYGKTRFEATCAVVKEKLKGKEKLNPKNVRDVLMKKEENKGAQPNLGQNNESVPTDSSQPTNKIGTSVLKKIWAKLREWVWGRREYEDDIGEKVLKDSVRLVEDLQKLKPEIKWKLISETWMEMLGYAAIHCDSYQHAKSLSRGGELLTHLWLLMSQLGVVDEHKVQQYQSGTV
ncbi:uncharacterized protein LOC144560885 [Carex rostrata]